MQITGIVIPAELEQPVYTIDYDRGDTKSMRETVGGPFDVVDTDDPAASVWLNDEGIINGLPQNVRATMFIWAGKPRLRGVQGYFGDTLVTGQPDEEGETTTVSGDILRLFFQTEQYKVEAKFKSEDDWRVDDSRFSNYWTALHWALTMVTNSPIIEDVRVKPA